MSGGYRKSDSALFPGKVGRKTGFQVTWTPSRGANGLEDPKEFFLSDDEFESQETTTTSPVKRLSMRYTKLQELRGSSPAQQKQQLVERLEQVVEKGSEGISAMASASASEDRLVVFAPDAGKDAEAVEEVEAVEVVDGGNSDIDSDMDIEEVIKRAEDIGTPIRIPRRTLTSITGSPASNSNTLSQLDKLLGNTSNGSKLTKNIALNKNTKSSKFQPQDITNVDAERKSGVGETTGENTAVVEGESEAAKEEEPSNNGSNRRVSGPPSDRLEVITEIVDPVSEDPTEKLLFSQPDDHVVDTPQVKESSPPATQVISQPSVSPKRKESLAGDADKTSDDIDSKIVEAVAEEKPKPKPRLQVRKEKPVTTTDIVEFIISKDDHNTSMQERKANNLLRRKAAKKSYSTSELITSGSEDESSDEVPADDSKTSIAKKSKSMDHASRTPNRTVNSKVSKMRVPIKPKVASRQNSKIKSAQPATPIRRSTRTRVPPVASWKNEKILYKTEKVNGVIVKSVDNVLHRPDTDKEHATPLARNRKVKTKKEEETDLQPVIKKKAAKTSSITKAKKPAKPVTAESQRIQKEHQTKLHEKVLKTKSVRKPKAAVEREEARSAEKKDSKNPVKKSSKRKLEISANTTVPPKSRSKLKKPKLSSVEKPTIDQENISVEYPPSGWQGTSEGSLTLSIFEGPGTEKQVERTVAYAPGSYKNVTIIKSDDEYFKVGTLFDQDCEFCGGGIIELPSGARKAVKSNHDTYFIFYVISGEVEVTLSRNTFTVTEGCSFEIPMGNYYQFVNTGGDMAKMMFVQAKYVVIGDKDSSDSDDDNSEDGDEGSETA